MATHFFVNCAVVPFLSRKPFFQMKDAEGTQNNSLTHTELELGLNLRNLKYDMIKDRYRLG